MIKQKIPKKECKHRFLRFMEDLFWWCVLGNHKVKINKKGYIVHVYD